jgi:hypothetical protein
MLQVEVESSKLEEKLASMQGLLKNFPEQMAHELTQWQTEDMNRRKPNTDFDGQSTATTIITQHTPGTTTKKSLVRSARRVVRQRREAKTAGQRRTSIPKPILRESLFTILCERMHKLMVEKLTWR